MKSRIAASILALGLGLPSLALAVPAKPTKPVPYPSQKTVQKYAELAEAVRAYRRPPLELPPIVGRGVVATGEVHSAADGSLLLGIPMDAKALRGLPESRARRVLDASKVEAGVVYDGKLFVRYAIDESAYPSDKLDGLVGRKVQLELIRREGLPPVAMRLVTP